MGIENAILIGLSRQMALRHQMDMVANNIANLNTTAYKSEELLFREYLVESEQGDQMSYVESYGTLRNTTEGAMRPTENPLDLAISGDGYFVVETEDGAKYTRNGHFRLNEEGQLTTMDGDPVLDIDDRIIEFADPSIEITISRDGSITGVDGEDFRIAVVSFENEQALKKDESGLYKTDQDPVEVETPGVLQGMLEASNVQPIIQMTNMIEVQRAYEQMQKAMNTEHDLQRDAISRLGKIA